MFNIISGVIPNLINGLTGGLGGAAKKILEDINIKLPKDEDPSVSLEKIIAEADPETLERIKKADLDFKSKMKEMDIDLEKIKDEGTQNARDMQRDIKSKLVPFLAIIILIYSFTLLGCLFFIDFPESNRDLINIFFGLCLGFSGNVVTFYFGSSQSSQNKDKVLYKNK